MPLLSQRRVDAIPVTPPEPPKLGSVLVREFYKSSGHAMPADP